MTELETFKATMDKVRNDAHRQGFSDGYAYALRNAMGHATELKTYLDKAIQSMETAWKARKTVSPDTEDTKATG